MAPELLDFDIEIKKLSRSQLFLNHKTMLTLELVEWLDVISALINLAVQPVSTAVKRHAANTITLLQWDWVHNFVGQFGTAT